MKENCKKIQEEITAINKHLASSLEEIISGTI